LERSFAENCLHHAYILGGPESGAKLQVVQRFAAILFRAPSLLGGAGDEGPDEAALERIKRGNHPDFVLLRPEGQVIGVDEVRGLPKTLAYPPLEGARRVVVIESAECLNPQAANSILKILEEPPAHTMFFLLCRDPGELLPTIASRCLVLRIAPLSNEELAGLLAAGEFDPTLAGFSEGSLARARLLLDTENGRRLQEEACDHLLSLWEQSPRVPSAAFRFVEGIEGEEQARIVVDSWELLLRDFIFVLTGARAEELRLPTCYPRLATLRDRGRGRPESLAKKSAVLNRFRVYRDFNGNLRLDFAHLLPELQVFP
jgi:hypothetical protein